MNKQREKYLKQLVMKFKMFGTFENENNGTLGKQKDVPEHGYIKGGL